MTEKILITSPKCGTCENLKSALSKQGRLKDFRIVDIDSNEGQALVHNLDINGVPECAIVEDVGKQKVVRLCSDEEWARVLKGE